MWVATPFSFNITENVDYRHLAVVNHPNSAMCLALELSRRSLFVAAYTYINKLRGTKPFGIKSHLQHDYSFSFSCVISIGFSLIGKWMMIVNTE